MRGISAKFLDLIERNARFEYHAGGSTRVTYPHTTGWRVLPSLVVAQTGYRGVFEQEGRPPVSVPAGATIVMAPGRLHCGTMVSRRAGYSRWSHIQCDILQGVSLFFLIEPRPLVRGRKSERIGEINEELAQIAAHNLTLPSMVRRQTLGWELVSLLLEGARMISERHELARHATRLSPVLGYMEENLGQPITHQELARAAGLSPSRFNAVFRAALGSAPYEYVQQLRVRRAQQLLVRTDHSVAEIGREVGHPDPYHFSRAFRARVGVSPVAYRRGMIFRSL